MATQYTAGLTTGEVLTAATMNSIGAAWETFTPVITQGATITKTTVYSKYCRINKLIVFTGRFTLTSAGSAANELQITLPFNSANPSVTGVVGSAIFFDNSAARSYVLLCMNTFAGNVRFWYDNVADQFGVTPAVTAANNDILSFTITYEVA